jgi:hypothetical protein
VSCLLCFSFLLSFFFTTYNARWSIHWSGQVDGSEAFEFPRQWKHLREVDGSEAFEFLRQWKHLREVDGSEAFELPRKWQHLCEVDGSRIWILSN